MKTRASTLAVIAALSFAQSTYGFSIDLGIAKVSDKGIDIRSPEEAVKATVQIVNPATHIERAAEIVQANTGGDVAKLAGDIRREAGNASELTSEMAGSAVAVTELTLQDPKRGLPRLMACSTTACLSEVQAKRQMREQEEALRSERQAQLEAYRGTLVAEERAKVEANYNLLLKELAEVEDQIAIFLEASTALTSVETALQGRIDLDQEVQAVVGQLATEANQNLLERYVRHLAGLQSEAAGTTDYTKAGEELQTALVVSAQAAQLTAEEFLQRVSEGLDDSKAAALLIEIQSIQIEITDIYSFLESEKQQYLAELEAHKTSLGIQ